MGNFDVAKKMINIASLLAGVHSVKFQKRTVRELLDPGEFEAQHPCPEHSFGPSYGRHREFLEFDLDQHSELKRTCEANGAKYACSVWDLTAAKQITSLKPSSIKIPSASNLDFQLMEWVCTQFPGEILVSLGMTSRQEEAAIIDLFVRTGRMQDLVLYACTSGYPVPFPDICLLEIRRLCETYGSRIAAVGFSGHHLGIAADVAALTLGATRFERHFTLDRTWKGTDQAASLEPDGMRKLVRDLGNVNSGLRYKDPEILPIEQEMRAKLKRRLPDGLSR